MQAFKSEKRSLQLSLDEVVLGDEGLLSRASTDPSRELGTGHRGGKPQPEVLEHITFEEGTAFPSVRQNKRRHKTV